MKKLLIATLFAVFTLSANAQTEEVIENKSEITTTIHLNFETSLKNYFIMLEKIEKLTSLN